jgi:DNA-binding transcriptional regulator YhcF (GntR family)
VIVITLAAPGGAKVLLSQGALTPIEGRLAVAATLLTVQELARTHREVSYQRLLRGIKSLSQEGLVEIRRGPNNDVMIPADKLLLVERLVALMERDYGAAKAALFLKQQIEDIERIQRLTDDLDDLKRKYRDLEAACREAGVSPTT